MYLILGSLAFVGIAGFIYWLKNRKKNPYNTYNMSPVGNYPQNTSSPTERFFKGLKKTADKCLGAGD